MTFKQPGAFTFAKVDVPGNVQIEQNLNVCQGAVAKVDK